MLLQLHEGRLARDAATAAAAAASTPGHTAVDVLGRVGRVGRVHPGLGRAGGSLVGAPPEIRKVERVGADRGHFFEMNRKAVGGGGKGSLPAELTQYHLSRRPDFGTDQIFTH